MTDRVRELLAGTSARSRLILVAGAVLLFVLSRLPFLLSHSDWGVFVTEHLWIITDGAAVDRTTSLLGDVGATLGRFNPLLYDGHYHAGGLWITEAVRYVGRLTGEHGLRELKLIGFVCSLIAVCAYLGALMAVWPKQPLRWAAGVYVAWLAPPTLLLWMTLMPMGHYMETWFFHALFLPPLVLVLQDKAGPVVFGLAGAVAGLSATYVFSNLVFPVLLGFLFLLLTRRAWWNRALCLLSLGATTAASWYVVAGARMGLVADRVGRQSHLSEPDVGARVERVLVNTGRLASRRVVLYGDVWSERGIFAVLAPDSGMLGAISAYGLFLAGAGGAAYMLWHTALLLYPRTARELDLAGRMLGAHGLLLLATVGAYVAILPTSWGMGSTSYVTISYAALMFGLAQGLVALLGRGRGPLRIPARGAVAAVMILLGVGWAQEGVENLRGLDRPDVQRTDFRTPIPMAALAQAEGAEVDSAAVEALCNRAYPENELFCAVIGWQAEMEFVALRDLPARNQGDALPELDFDPARARVTAALCAEASPDRLQACALAVGAQLYSRHSCVGAERRAGVGSMCSRLPAELEQACVTGMYQGPVLPFNDLNPCTLDGMSQLCRGDGDLVMEWMGRACLEGVAYMFTGMPPLPVAQSPVQGACSRWPKDWQGLCQGLGGHRQAQDGEPSCEDVYLERFADDLPSRHGLIYQQCAFVEGVAEGREFYPSCVIGAARVLEGLECSWRGSELRL